MYAKNITREQLLKAAAVYGFETDPTVEENRHRIKFTLRSGTNEQYRKISRRYPFGSDRRTRSVCLHGHYRFFVECLKLAPDAIFESGLYGKIVHTKDTLEENYDRMRYMNIGSQFYPVMFDHSRECGEAAI